MFPGKGVMVKKEEIVKQGYDRIAKRYHAERSQFGHKKELEEFMRLLPAKANVLDAGCGAGVPIAQALVEHGFSVTGVDISEKMLALARRNVPGAVFARKDMARLDFESGSFDGAVSFYAIIHVPREKHQEIFRGFHRVLKPDGIILVCMGPDEWEATEEYKGTLMFWSHYAPEKSLQIIKDAGFDIISGRLLKRGGETHYWVLAKNKGRKKKTKK